MIVPLTTDAWPSIRILGTQLIDNPMVQSHLTISKSFDFPFTDEAVIYDVDEAFRHDFGDQKLFRIS